MSGTIRDGAGNEYPFEPSDLDAIRARDEAGKYEGPPDPNAPADRHTLLIRVAALEAALREARGDVAAMIGAAQLMGVPKGNDGMVLALRRLREIDALLTGSTPERRKADEPWKIPARVGELVVVHDGGLRWEFEESRVDVSWAEYRRLMGRRREDWSDHG